MAKNTGEGYRIGSVDDRTQVKNPATGKWTKRDRSDGDDAGEFIDVKRDGKWLLDRVTDNSKQAVPSHYEQLKALEWMVGLAGINAYAPVASGILAGLCTAVGLQVAGFTRRIAAAGGVREIMQWTAAFIIVCSTALAFRSALSLAASMLVAAPVALGLVLGAAQGRRPAPGGCPAGGRVRRGRFPRRHRPRHRSPL